MAFFITLGIGGGETKNSCLPPPPVYPSQRLIFEYAPDPGPAGVSTTECLYECSALISVYAYKDGVHAGFVWQECGR